MNQGTIARLVRDRGFGFIKPADGADDLFFHRSGCDHFTPFETLVEGDHVEFEIEPSPSIRP